MKLEILNKTKIKEINIFFSLFKKINSIVNFKKKIFFIRYYYKKFMEKKEKNEMEIRKYKYYFILFKSLCLSYTKNLIKYKKENKRIQMIRTIIINKIISGIFSFFSRKIRMKKIQRQTMNIKILKVKKKFIRVLKKLNIMTMIQQILEYKHFLLLKKQVIKNLFEVSVNRHKLINLCKKFYLKIFMIKLSFISKKKEHYNNSITTKIKEKSIIEEDLNKQFLLEKRYFSTLFLKKSKIIFGQKHFFISKIEDCKKLFFNIKIYKFIFNVKEKIR